VASVETPALTLLYLLYFLDAFVEACNMRNKTCNVNDKKTLPFEGKAKGWLCWNPSYVFVATLLFHLSILPTWFWWEAVSFLGAPALFSSPVIEESAIEHAQ